VNGRPNDVFFCETASAFPEELGWLLLQLGDPHLAIDIIRAEVSEVLRATQLDVPPPIRNLSKIRKTPKIRMMRTGQQ
jgi:hypothetical protein